MGDDSSFWFSGSQYESLPETSKEDILGRRKQNNHENVGRDESQHVIPHKDYLDIDGDTHQHREMEKETNPSRTNELLLGSYSIQQNGPNPVSLSTQRNGITTMCQDGGGFVLKEKFKMLKVDLKKWNKEEIIRKNEARAKLLLNIGRKDNLLCQKARCKWLNEGDANTSFYHRVINKRRKMNEITGIKIEGEWKEEAAEVKKISLISLNNISNLISKSNHHYVRISLRRKYQMMKTVFLLLPLLDPRYWKLLRHVIVPKVQARMALTLDF
ncbi:hypothetical protein ACS0TY_016309 [Phlomoides rotata]